MTPPTPQQRALHRRTVLGGAAVGAAAVTVAAPGSAVPPPSYFRHGVASGDPLPDAVLIWTRVTATGRRLDVRWEVARDARFRDVVRHGTFTTSASRDYTVKVDVTGLRPATRYFYRFRYADSPSPVGRTRTAPAHDATPERLRFGVVSCANLQAGWFSAYRGLAARNDLDAVVHLGDYLYEYGPGQYGYGMNDEDIRSHEPRHEMVSLEDHRRRHAQYKTDPDLQALHAKYPWIVTWDDHEVANDQYKDGAENHNTDLGEGGYHLRRARAHRAYDEWMPVRMDGTARLGDGDRLYRRLRFGRLAEISMLDLRSYRDAQAAAPGPGVSDPDRTLTGRRQMSWLKDSLSRGRAQWKVVGNPVMIAPVDFAGLPDVLLDPINDVTGLLPRDGVPYNVDQWDGYTDDRREVFQHIRDHQVSDALFITGDIHSGWACELPYDASTHPVGDSAGVEFVCSSVTSNNLKDITGTPPRTTSVAVETLIKTNNRHIKYLDFDSHGFSVLDLTPERAQMDWYVIGDRADRDTDITWAVSWATRTGTGRIESVEEPV